jgi:Sec-independent protein translocase protein TatA
VDVAELVLEYIKVLVWPGIAIAAILMFRTQLGEFIANIASAVKRVKKVSAPGTSLELAEFVSELSEQVEDAVQTSSTDGTDRTSADSGEDSLDDLTVGKIMRIWGEIEKSTRYLSELQAPGNAKLRFNFREQVRLLVSAGLFTPRLADSLTQAFQIRSQIAHGTWTLPLGTFDDYVRSIVRLNNELKFISEGAL